MPDILCWEVEHERTAAIWLQPGQEALENSRSSEKTMQLCSRLQEALSLTHPFHAQQHCASLSCKGLYEVWE